MSDDDFTVGFILGALVVVMLGMIIISSTNITLSSHSENPKSAPDTFCFINGMIYQQDNRENYDWCYNSTSEMKIKKFDGEWRFLHE